VNGELACAPRKVTSVIESEVHEAHFRGLLTKLGYPLADEDHNAFESTGLKAKSFISCAVGKFELRHNKNK